MALKKTEIYRSLWAGCDELRGGMEASQYKDYVLTLLFMKYVSDKYAGDEDSIIFVPEGATFDDLVALKGDREIGDKINKIISNLAEENDLKGVIDVADFNNEDKLGKGKDMVDRLSRLVAIFNDLDLSANRAEGDDILGDAYEYLMRHFATESGKSKGQFYTPTEVSRVVAQVLAIPADTSQDATVYDPTCGSGSLLLKVVDESPHGLKIYGQEMDNSTVALARMNMFMHNYPKAEIWQDNTLSSPYWKNDDGSLKTFDFAVANPPFSYKSWSNGLNPSMDEFNRFEYGVPPAKNGDYAFLLHILKSLNSTGKAAVILPHGVLFRGNTEATIRQELVGRGYIKGIIGLPANLFYSTAIPAYIIVIDKATAAERQGLFMVDGSNAFIKDGNKNRLRSQDIHKIVDVFNHQIELPRYSRMVSLEEIAKNDYNLNIPRYIDSSLPEDIHDLDAHLNGGIPNADIEALDNYWQVFPSLKTELFAPAREGYSKLANANYQLSIKNNPEFTDFAERTLALYCKWRKSHEKRLKAIARGEKPKDLIVEISEDLLKQFIEAELVDKYDIYQILMNYWVEVMQDDVYLLVQDGWEAGRVWRELVMKKGEKLKETPDLIVGKQKFKTDLVPSELITNRFFSQEKEKLDNLNNELEEIEQKIESMVEENGGENGFLENIREGDSKIKRPDVLERVEEYENLALKAFSPSVLEQIETTVKLINNLQKELDDLVNLDENQDFFEALKGKSGKVTKTNVDKKKKELSKQDVNSREKSAIENYSEKLAQKSQAESKLKGLRKERDRELEKVKKQHKSSSEIQELTGVCDFLSLIDEEKSQEESVKTAQVKLNEAVLAKYPELTEQEIKILVVDDKWQATLEGNIKAEIERVRQQLANRVKVLDERYAETLPDLEMEVENWVNKVEEDLQLIINNYN